MEIGYEEASPIVHATRKFAGKNEKDYDYIIIDTAAGTHCNAISALIGTDIAFAVTEPTPLGSHDLELILRLLKVLKVPSQRVLNRSDIGKTDLVEEVSRSTGSPIIASVPYSREFLESYSRGIPVEHEAIKKMAGYVRGL
jgi:MinD superfamily P-loop ATPase